MRDEKLRTSGSIAKLPSISLDATTSREMLGTEPLQRDITKRADSDPGPVCPPAEMCRCAQIASNGEACVANIAE
jgi:hypothetical protein